MSTIQNLKNFIRHGKQARAAEPTTQASPVHAQPQKHGVSDPAAGTARQKDYSHVDGYSVGAVNNRNVAAQAQGTSVNAPSKQQKVDRDADLASIVAEERAAQGKLPKYPGLERYVLVEKMGDGAFSNVYRAKDTQRPGEVAIKVVRKFEMNSNQVCLN